MSLLKLSKKKKAKAEKAVEEFAGPVVDTTPRPDPVVLYSKPTADLYTVMLVISLIAVLVGILFLYLEMDMYKFKLKNGPAVGMVWEQTQYAVAAISARNPLSFSIHDFL